MKRISLFIMMILIVSSFSRAYAITNVVAKLTTDSSVKTHGQNITLVFSVENNGSTVITPQYPQTYTVHLVPLNIPFPTAYNSKTITLNYDLEQYSAPGASTAFAAATVALIPDVPFATLQPGLYRAYISANFSSIVNGKVVETPALAANTVIQIN